MIDGFNKMFITSFDEFLTQLSVGVSLKLPEILSFASTEADPAKVLFSNCHDLPNANSITDYLSKYRVL